MQPESDRTVLQESRHGMEVASTEPLEWFGAPAPVIRAEALLAAAPDADAWYWSSGGDQEFAAVGVVRRLMGSGAARFHEVDRELRALWGKLDRHPETDAEAPAPRVVGGFAFHEGRSSQKPWESFGDAQMLLPRLTYTRRGARAWMTIAATAQELASTSVRAHLRDEAARLIEAARSHSVVDLDAPQGPFELAGEDARRWRRQIEAAKRAIASGSFEKVVLARHVIARFARELSTARVLLRLGASGPDEPRFALRIGGTTFLGSPPERLLKKTALAIETEAVAGSSPAHDERSDLVQRDAKLLAEHAPVVQDLVERLLPAVDLAPIPERPVVHRARHILHLKTPISGTLRTEERALSLLARIHPTPAVGGYPTRPALRFIAEHEPDERGWYAGPIGWVDAEDNADFAVALRSGVIKGKQAQLYVGAGIVSGSESNSELIETGWKLRVLLGALG